MSNWTIDPFAPRQARPAASPAPVPAAVPAAVEPIHAWTDGAAKGNPGPAAWSWWVTDGCWAAGGWPLATNNLAELTAVAQILEATSHLAHRPLHITTDSTYVRDALTKWIHGWKRNGWRTKAGEPVKNADVIAAIDAALSSRDVTLHWTKGHAANAGNNAADARCSAFAAALRDGSTPDPGPGWTH